MFKDKHNQTKQLNNKEKVKEFITVESVQELNERKFQDDNYSTGLDCTGRRLIPEKRENY